ncbi:MAG: hypothetical protein RRY40_03545 [Oscillospiraceae bacterium]
MKSNIRIAETAGFCFGVNRGVNIIYEALESGKQVATLGPIIHNGAVVEGLRQKGVTVIAKPSEGVGKTVVIRSHGVSRQVIEELEKFNIPYIDATCPFVANIHKIVASAEENSIIIIAGDKSHPEVLGIIGHCSREFL